MTQAALLVRLGGLAPDAVRMTARLCGSSAHSCIRLTPSSSSGSNSCRSRAPWSMSARNARRMLGLERRPPGCGPRARPARAGPASRAARGPGRATARAAAAATSPPSAADPSDEVERLQPGPQQRPRQPFVEDQLADLRDDAAAVARDEGGVRKRDAERVDEQGADGEPVGQAADQGRLAEGQQQSAPEGRSPSRCDAPGPAPPGQRRAAATSLAQRSIGWRLRDRLV